MDTNVVYPVIIRDLLFWFAYFDLYTPKWSDPIFYEWKKVMKEKGGSEEEADKRIEKANLAFLDALVKNYKGLINHLELPDKDNRHFLAAALKTNANLNAKPVFTNTMTLPHNSLYYFKLFIL